MTANEGAAPGKENGPIATGEKSVVSTDSIAEPAAIPRANSGNGYGMGLFSQHAEMLKASGIPPEHARKRGYISVDTKKRLEDLKITKAGRNTPGLLIPLRRKDGSAWGYQYRPDEPRLSDKTEKPIKYETPYQQLNGVDVPPGVGPMLDDPSIPLWITEGSKKADAAYLAGLCCVSISGVWNFRGKNIKGGKVIIPDLQEIAVNDRRIIMAFDGDVAAKPSVHMALRDLSAYLESKGGQVEYAHLPHDPSQGKTGLDDFLAASGVEELWRLVSPDMPGVVYTEQRKPDTKPEPEPQPELKPCTLAEAQAVFKKWLGDGYDQDALHADLAAAAVERLDGDPLWLLIISGSGNAKTETVQALTGAGAVSTSTISSEGALLSGTSDRERGKDATGGLLRQMGERGLLVIKDVTSILSMNGERRLEVLSALRDVYDGRWDRSMGVDGGKVLHWSGRIVIVGAVTTKWDQAHSVIAAMGDRFVLLRMDSNNKKTRLSAGRKALGNTGSEIQMRAELAEAAGGVIAGMNPVGIELTEDESERLLEAADLVTRARTAVEYDSRGDVVDAHAVEMPTRFAKQLQQVMRGAVAIGVPRDEAFKLAIRCARDSVPPLRMSIIDDLSENPHSTSSDVRKRLNKPRATIDRQLQALHMLEVVDCDELPYSDEKMRWYYSLAEGVDPDTLNLETSPVIDPPIYKDDADHRAAGGQQDSSLKSVYVGVSESGEVEEAENRPEPPPPPPSRLSEPTTNGPHGACEVCQEPIHAAMARLGVTRCRKHPIGAVA
jgi:hypothetical protein